MDRFEYRVVSVDLSNYTRLGLMLNNFGSEGWELVSVTQNVAFLKRKIRSGR